MGIRVKPACARSVAAAALAALIAAASGASAATASTTAQLQSTAQPRSTAQPQSTVTHTVTAAAQQATRSFWTARRMAAATPPGRGGQQAVTPDGAPPGTPSPTQFAGVPTIGALFFTTGTKAHFCSASVIDSMTGNIVLTAAHCVYGSSYASHIEFVPAYHHGKQPFGAWPVHHIVVAAGWRKSHDPNLDFAFLTVTPPPGTSKPVQHVTGGLWLGVDTGYTHAVEVVGYNNTGDAPIKCATHSFEFRPRQLKFFCRDYQDGTSGGPWVLSWNSRTGTGVAVGLIGGYDEGGDYPWASFSAYFGSATLHLFLQAEKQQS